MFIPAEEFNAPAVQRGCTSSWIRGLTKDALQGRATQPVGHGVALSEDSVEDVIDVALFVGIDEDDLRWVTNREVRPL